MYRSGEVGTDEEICKRWNQRTNIECYERRKSQQFPGLWTQKSVCIQGYHQLGYKTEKGEGDLKGGDRVEFISGQVYLFPVAHSDGDAD